MRDLDRQAWIERARAVPIMDELARRGIKLRRKGSEHEGPCPKCGGRDRFSVHPGKHVWNCRACSTGGDVIALVEHLDGGTFDQNVTTLAGPLINGKANSKHAARRAPVVTEHRYEDESGELHFVVVRTANDGKKEIKQKRPDPARAGHWLHSVKGCRVIPYKLPELIEAVANDHLIAVVEGEKKADLLARWGVAATCNAGGAGKWKAEHAAFLKGTSSFFLTTTNPAPSTLVSLLAASSVLPSASAAWCCLIFLLKATSSTGPRQAARASGSTS